MLFKQRMLEYKKMELLSLTITGELFSEGRKLLGDIFDLCFPWASKEIEENERRKLQDLIDMAKNFNEKT